LLTPGKQFLDEHVIERNALLEASVLTSPDALFDYRTLRSQTFVFEGDVFPSNSSQFASPKSSSKIEQHH